MPSITEKNLTFDFPPTWIAVKYDKPPFYIKQYQPVINAKAVDILAIEPMVCCWFIEVKDYRQGHQTKIVEIANDVARKVRDTIAGLATARIRAAGDDKQVAQESMNCPEIRVVLHLETPTANSALRITPINPANVQDALKRLIRVIDPHLRAVNIGSSAQLPWQVR